MLFDCPLKTATQSTVEDLLANHFRVRIITGDNPYTACEIARKCGIVDESAPMLLLNEDKKYVKSIIPSSSSYNHQYDHYTLFIYSPTFL